MQSFTMRVGSVGSRRGGGVDNIATINKLNSSIVLTYNQGFNSNVDLK